MFLFLPRFLPAQNVLDSRVSFVFTLMFVSRVVPCSFSVTRFLVGFKLNVKVAYGLGWKSTCALGARGSLPDCGEDARNVRLRITNGENPIKKW